jgi:hypothetical protein
MIMLRLFISITTKLGCFDQENYDGNILRFEVVTAVSSDKDVV